MFDEVRRYGVEVESASEVQDGFASEVDGGFECASELEPEPQVRRSVEIDASPEEVWEAIATDEGRERWLEDDPDRELTVEPGAAPGRIVWWWRTDPAQPPHRVEVRVVAVPAGARVIVTETAPLFPLARLEAAFALVLA
jgi:uncharacterized protein YndB with AHSA1/START domain